MMESFQTESTYTHASKHTGMFYRCSVIDIKKGDPAEQSCLGLAGIVKINVS